VTQGFQPFEEFDPELELELDVPTERLTPRQRRQIFNAQKARRERQRKNGAGFAHPANTVALPGTGIVPPISAGQEAIPTYLSWYSEWNNATLTQYPATGATTNAMVNTGVFCVGTVAASGLFRIIDLASVVLLQFDLSLTGHTGHHGFNQTGVLFDPVGDRIALFVNGDQVAAVAHVHAAWSAGTWNYMWNTGTASKPTSIGLVSPLEVFPGYIPAGFTL